MNRVRIALKVNSMSSAQVPKSTKDARVYWRYIRIIIYKDYSSPGAPGKEPITRIRNCYPTIRSQVKRLRRYSIRRDIARVMRWRISDMNAKSNKVPPPRAAGYRTSMNNWSTNPRDTAEDIEPPLAPLTSPGYTEAPATHPTWRCP